MQTRGSTNKSPNKLSVTKNKLTRWFVYEWGKPTWQKPPPGDFKVTTPEISLLSQQAVTVKEKFHYYHNKRLQVKESQYFIPTYSWTLTLIPNWTYSVVTISPLDAWLPVRD